MRPGILTSIILAIMLAPLLNVGTALACIEEGPKSGYWFYNECETNTESNDEYELGPMPTHIEMMQMHPDEIAIIIDERLKYSIYKQTPESVVDYYKAIDVSRRKALAHTALTEYVMLKNPELNAKSQNPVSVPARKAATLTRNREHENYIATNKREYAIVMFSKKTCHFCPIQEATLKNFQSKFGWKYKTIDVDLNPEIAIKHGATVTPTTILIQRGTQEWMPISVGAESVSEVETGVYRALRSLKNEITPTQYITERYREGGFFDPTSSKGL